EGFGTLDPDTLATVIIIAYALMDFEEAKTFKPTVVFPKEGNKV
ncbi:aspartate 1-decarboxylase, partial [Vibrio cholerae O1]|nr:aspartate 1-decarboxylase [Vibrio cholerae O1]